MRFKEQVAKGIALLSDEQLHSVNLDAIDMTSYDECILGQIFGSTSNGIRELKLATDGVLRIDTIYEYGFAAERDADAPVLIEEWRSAIRDRAAAEARRLVRDPEAAVWFLESVLRHAQTECLDGREVLTVFRQALMDVVRAHFDVVEVDLDGHD